jgi:hypothetical protein
MKLRRPTAGEISALVALGLVAVFMFARGDHLYSPGALSDSKRTNVALGGVSSHADTGRNCGACHAPPWSKETMADRCLNCHADVRRQIDGGLSLHGKFAAGRKCRQCHTEHKGAHGTLTSLAHFDHDCARFHLTGAHRQVACQSCHTGGGYKGTPQTCAGCHAEPPTPAVHKHSYGKSCASCHGTQTWKGSSFQHTIFSINHGRRRGTQSTCATCHPNAEKPREYTCYNCHEHRPAKIERIHLRRNIVEYDDCIKCHSRRSRRGERRR